ncbi:MAG: hypothetical protein ABIG35_09405 [Pseudomonadota bacterium]
MSCNTTFSGAAARTEQGKQSSSASNRRRSVAAEKSDGIVINYWALGSSYSASFSRTFGIACSHNDSDGEREKSAKIETKQG